MTRSLLPGAHFVRELEECAKGRRNITCSLFPRFPIARELERCENKGGRKVTRSHLPRVPTPQGVFFALTSPNG